MRPLEKLLACLVAVGSVFLLAGGHSGFPVVAGFLLALFGLTAAHLFLEGVHWQLVPLYLAEAGLVLFGLFAGDGEHGLLARFSGGLFLLLLFGAFLLSWMLPMFRLPEPSGPHPVGTRILQLSDSKRDAWGGREPGSKRELMVQVWYPAAKTRGPREVYRRRPETTRKSAYQSVLRTQSIRNAPMLDGGAPYPVLIFNPAWTGQRTQSTFLMQELASHGYVVASIDHTYYSGLVAFPDGRVLDGHMAPALGDFTHLSIQEGIELGDQFIGILAEDVVFVLDELLELNARPESEWHGRLDAARVGVLGHSAGGAAAAEACLLDARIKAALNLDGWTFGEVLRHGLAKPWMVIYGKGIEVEPADLAAQPEGVQRYWQMNRENFAAVEKHLARTGGQCVLIEGASHWNFSDRPLYSPLRSRTQAGTIDAAVAHRKIAEAVRVFFGQALR